MRRTQRGFTIVELLVVITIIGLLMALLIPAASSAIIAARRAACETKVRQLCIGAFTYANKKGNFPPLLSGSQNYGWPIWLAPYYSRQDLYDQALNSGLVPNSVEPLMCPSDPPTNGEAALLSYGANAGRPNGGGGANMPRDWKDNGVFQDNRPGALAELVTIDYITSNDGLPNTICFAENVTLDQWTANSEPGLSVLWLTGPSIGLNKDLNGAVDNNHARPASRHGPGMVVGFCDSHVIFMPENVDYLVYSMIMTPAGKRARNPGSTTFDLAQTGTFNEAALNP